jgi:hypothetical protein
MTAPFSIPIEWLGGMDLEPDETLEIEVAGSNSAGNHHELATELSRVPDVEMVLYERKAFDIPQLIYLAGAVGGMLQGIDVAARWLSAKREKQRDVRLTIRTTQGKVELDADDLGAARDLASKLREATKKPKNR